MIFTNTNIHNNKIKKQRNHYNQIRRKIIHFLEHHHEMKYCKPLGTTAKLINDGKDPVILEYKSVKAMKNSKRIRYTPLTTHLRRLGGKHTLVYMFLIMDINPVKYAKYGIKYPNNKEDKNNNKYEVFWFGWHTSTNPKDKNFYPLNY